MPCSTLRGEAIVATRIERVSGCAAYKLRGVVGARVDGRSNPRIGSGGDRLECCRPGEPSMSLAPGSVVRVTLATTPRGSAWRATLPVARQAMLEDRERVEVEGRITAFTSSTRFEIKGLPVDAVERRFPNGTAGVVLGAKVEVEGRCAAA